MGTKGWQRSRCRHKIEKDLNVVEVNTNNCENRMNLVQPRPTEDCRATDHDDFYYDGNRIVCSGHQVPNAHP